MSALARDSRSALRTPNHPRGPCAALASAARMSSSASAAATSGCGLRRLLATATGDRFISARMSALTPSSSANLGSVTIWGLLWSVPVRAAATERPRPPRRPLRAFLPYTPGAQHLSGWLPRFRLGAGLRTWGLWSGYNRHVNLNGPVRWIIAVAAAIGLQICCCNLEAMVRVCIACDDHAEPAPADLTHNHDEPAGAHQSHDHPTTAEDQHEPSPCDNHDEEGECTCESHELAKSLPEKPRLEVPAFALIALLPQPQFDNSGFAPVSCRWAPNEGVFPPPTSLLRLHCALIV